MADVPYPYKRLVPPPSIANHNGELPQEALARLSAGGWGWFNPYYCGGFVFAFNLMYDAALKDGVKLVAVSEGYRSLARQEALFYDRYDDKPTGRKPEVTRYYKGVKWWLRVGKSPSATPG